jgi:hypothetical protein
MGPRLKLYVKKWNGRGDERITRAILDVAKSDRMFGRTAHERCSGPRNGRWGKSGF